MTTHRLLLGLWALQEPVFRNIHLVWSLGFERGRGNHSSARLRVHHPNYSSQPCTFVSAGSGERVIPCRVLGLPPIVSFGTSRLGILQLLLACLRTKHNFNGSGFSLWIRQMWCTIIEEPPTRDLGSGLPVSHYLLLGLG